MNVFEKVYDEETGAFFYFNKKVRLGLMCLPCLPVLLFQGFNPHQCFGQLCIRANMQSVGKEVGASGIPGSKV